MKRQHPKGKQRQGIHERKKRLDSIKELMRKSPSKAKTELLLELSEYPEDMYCWFYYGQLCQAESNLAEAEDAYTKVADSNSRNKYAGVVGLADIARIKGNNEEAIRLYRKAIVEHPGENRTTYYILARMESGVGNYEEALRILNQLGDNCNETKLEKARTYIEIGDIKKAASIVESIIPQNEIEKRDLAYAQAKIYIFQEKYQLATYYFLEARECKIKDAQYYKILSDEAKLAIEVENYQLAIDNCEEALAANELAHGDSYVTLALAKQGLGQYEAAIKCFQMALTESSISYLPKTTCCYYLACLQIAMGEIEQAEKTLKLSVNPNLSPRQSIVDLLLNIYITQKRYDEAKNLISFAKRTIKIPKELDALNFAEIIVAARTGANIRKEELVRFGYREKQAIDYSKSEAIEHIAMHHQLGGAIDGNFPKDKDISQLYDEIQGQLTEENRSAIDVVDRYFIDYPNAGYSPDGDIIHRIGVVTLPGTKDIITMYPDIDSKAQRITPKNVMATISKKSHTSTDRISKFNSRFANFTPPKK